MYLVVCIRNIIYCHPLVVCIRNIIYLEGYCWSYLEIVPILTSQAFLLKIPWSKPHFNVLEPAGKTCSGRFFRLPHNRSFVENGHTSQAYQPTWGLWTHYCRPLNSPNGWNQPLSTEYLKPVTLLLVSHVATAGYPLVQMPPKKELTAPNVSKEKKLTHLPRNEG
jgi:hypothetical protein